MKYRSIFISLFLLSIASTSFGENLVLCPYSDSERGEFLLAIEKNRIVNLPTVDLEKENPPITIKHAIESAKEFLYSRFNDAKDLQANSICFYNSEYQTLPKTSLGLYEIHFHGLNEKDQSHSNIFVAFIAMDGKPLLFLNNKQTANQQVEPIVTTPVDEVEAQSTQAHP